MAEVNIQTGKITNCKNEFEWKHEKAHLIYSEKYASIQYIQERSLYFSIGCLCMSFFINFFKYIASGLFLISLALDVYEEIWCNDQADRKVYK